MLANFRQISIFNKIFNVNGGEWPRISLVWVIRFLYRVGFVVGWTVIVGMFVGRFGISRLPYLFGLNAVFVLLGTFLYSLVLGNIKREYLMAGTLFLSSVLLFVTHTFFQGNEVLLFSLLLVCISTFLFQFNVILGGFIEDLFTPLESERTFPLIESADTIGGISAGLIITLLAGSVDTLSFLFLWIALLLLIVPLLLFARKVSAKVPTLNKQIKQGESGEFLRLNSWSKLRERFSSIKSMPFVRGLFLIVFLQWVLYNLLDFQYTKAVYQNVSSVILDAGSGFEHAFVHDLGELFVLFSSLALLVQLLIGSRLINTLGVIGSMLVHPLLTIFSVVGLMFSFNFSTAVLAKNNFTMTTILYTNAYHSSYYAVNEHLREFTREFLEGVIRPVGALLGTLFILLLQRMFAGPELIFALNFTLLFFAVAMLWVLNRHQRIYTDSAIFDLINSKEREVRMNAIELLAQKGHVHGVEVLGSVVTDNREPVSIRVKALRAFAELQEAEAIPYLIKALAAKSNAIVENSLDALLAYKRLGGMSGSYLLLECELINTLKTVYKKSKDDDCRSKIIRLLSRISSVATVDFLLDIVKKEGGRLKADAIYTLGNYKDESIVDFVRPYLDSASLAERTAAIVALGRFAKYRAEAVSYVSKLIKSERLKDISAGLYAAGELNLTQFKRLCAKHLYGDNVELKIVSAIAMAKMGLDAAVPVLVELLFSSNLKVSLRVKKMLKNVDVRIFKNLDKIIKQMVSDQLSVIMEENASRSLGQLPKSKLRTLSWLYYLIEEYDEMEIVEDLL